MEHETNKLQTLKKGKNRSCKSHDDRQRINTRTLELPLLHGNNLQHHMTYKVSWHWHMMIGCWSDRITHKDTWAEGQELFLEEFFQRSLWVLSDVQHVMLSNLVDVHGVYYRTSEVRLFLTNEDSQLVGPFISSVQGKRNPQDQTTYTTTSSVFLLLQCSSSRSDWSFAVG